jgi:cell division protein FtsL
MMTAEKWYEHQHKYMRHGIEMKEREIASDRSNQDSVVTAQDKVKIILLLLVVGILCVSIIISTAYVAGVRHEINDITRQSADIRGQIENLNVQIERATNLRIIEERAKNELGMIYPLGSQVRFIPEDVRPQGDFAMRLRAQTLN